MSYPPDFIGAMTFSDKKTKNIIESGKKNIPARLRLGWEDLSKVSFFVEINIPVFSTDIYEHAVFIRKYGRLKTS